MKKIIISLLIFAIFAIGTTAGLIHYQKATSLSNSGESGENINLVNEAQENESQYENNEKTIDLYATYSENDLLIEPKSFLMEGYDGYIDIPQISGLKNKDVQQKINNSMRADVEKVVSKYIGKGEIKNLQCGFNNYDTANFSNVLSLGYSITYYIGEKYYYDILGLNYELINGNKLKLEDIFKKDEDMSTICRLALYKYIAENYRDMGMEGLGYDNVHYDIDRGAWYGNYYWYDEAKQGQRQEEREYIPVITEYDIEKKCVKFLSEDNKNFHFTPSDVFMTIDDLECKLKLKDIADKVVIYNKYNVSDSLYENSNMGHKSLLTCSAERDLSKYKETKFESDNFFYDIDCVLGGTYAYNMNNNYPAQKYLTNKTEEEVNKLREKVEEYKKIAANNKDKAYFLFGQSDISVGSEYKSGSVTYNSLLSTELGIRVFTCKMSEKQNIMDKLLANYRYPNLMFYGNIYQVSDGKTFLGIDYDERIEIPVQENVEKHIYDVLTGKELKTVAELFKDGVDYDWVIKHAPRADFLDDAKYDFDVYNIIVYDKEHEYGRYVSFNEISDYLKLKELKSEILPSNERQIEKVELEGMDKDEHYRAYNEIFARHGHDFKMQEYKYYFNLWDWYQPITGKTVSLEELSEIERYNVELIKSVIDEKD